MERSRQRRLGVLLVSAAMLSAALATTVAMPVAAAKASCGGKTATIVGTPRGETIYGTSRADVIAGLGGNDIIVGRGGDDLICGGTGADRLVGGDGRDRLLGNSGPDRLVGGAKADRLFGGVGNDVLLGRMSNDRLDGGPGTDTCYQDQGTGPVTGCELTHKPLPLSGLFALAYSDVDSRPGYSSGDVLIAKLVDTNGDGTVSVGDTVVMGRYPVDYDATSFGDWTVKSHTLSGVAVVGASMIVVGSAGGSGYYWYAIPGTYESYRESAGAASSLFQDSFSAMENDARLAEAGSPSAPQTAIPPSILGRATDDPFIDIWLRP